MDISCPECGKLHKLVDARFPDRKFAANCKKCGFRMIIDPTPSDNKSVNPSETKEETAKSQIITEDEYDIPLTEEERSENQDGQNEIGSDATIQNPDETESLEIKTSPKHSDIDPEDEILTAFPELRNFSPDKFILPEIFIKTGKRGYENRENRRILKIVKAIHDLLGAKILEAGEHIRRISKGISYHPFEIPYANGLMTLFSNYYALVCTDRRILMINIDRRLNRPTRYIFQLPYNDIKRVSRGIFLSSLIIDGKSGKRWNFTTVRRKLASSIKNFIDSRLDRDRPAAGEISGRNQLCPGCLTALPRNLTSCSECGVEFKRPKEALIRSFILPGLGEIYLGYLPLGIMEMVGYLFSWLLTIVLLILKVTGGIWIAIIPVLAYHMISGFLAWETARKGYLVEGGSGLTDYDLGIKEDSEKAAEKS